MFLNNYRYAASWGGVINNCEFRKNKGGALSFGGGIVTKSRFIANQASYGETVGCGYNPATFQDCLFENNYAEVGGAGGSGFNRTTLRNCILSGNRAIENGGAWFVREKSTLSIQNCTIVNNRSMRGNAIWSFSNSEQWPAAQISITNSILDNGATEI